jgi:hypothetical protein
MAAVQKRGKGVPRSEWALWRSERSLDSRSVSQAGGFLMFAEANFHSLFQAYYLALRRLQNQ